LEWGTEGDVATVRRAGRYSSTDVHTTPAGAWVSHVVLAQAVWVVSSVYKRTPQPLARAVAQLLAHESLVLQDAGVVARALEHFAKKPALGFSDPLPD